MEDLPVRQLMSHPVKTVLDSAPVSEAARCMTAHKVSALAVLDAKGRGVGVVSASDIVAYESTRADRVLGPARFGRLRARVLGKEQGGLAFQWTPEALVRDVMTRSLVTAPVSITLGQAARLMSQRRVHRIFLTRGGRIAGVLTSMDVTKAAGRVLGSPRSEGSATAGTRPPVKRGA